MAKKSVGITVSILLGIIILAFVIGVFTIPSLQQTILGVKSSYLINSKVEFTAIADGHYVSDNCRVKLTGINPNGKVEVFTDETTDSNGYSKMSRACNTGACKDFLGYTPRLGNYILKAQYTCEKGTQPKSESKMFGVIDKEELCDEFTYSCSGNNIKVLECGESKSFSSCDAGQTCSGYTTQSTAKTASTVKSELCKGQPSCNDFTYSCSGNNINLNSCGVDKAFSSCSGTCSGGDLTSNIAKDALSVKNQLCKTKLCDNVYFKDDYCKGDVLFYCNPDDGSSFDSTDCSEGSSSPSTCQNGACVLKDTAPTPDCVDNQIIKESCNNNELQYDLCVQGAWSHIIKICNSDQACSADTKECIDVEVNPPPHPPSDDKIVQCTQQKYMKWTNNECLFDIGGFFGDWGALFIIIAVILVGIVVVLIQMRHKK